MTIWAKINFTPPPPAPPPLPVEESFEESSESLDSDLVSSLHELRDSSSSTAVSGTKVPVCVGENSINQLSLASTYRKTFLL